MAVAFSSASRSSLQKLMLKYSLWGKLFVHKRQHFGAIGVIFLKVDVGLSRDVHVHFGDECLKLMIYRLYVFNFTRTRIQGSCSLIYCRSEWGRGLPAGDERSVDWSCLSLRRPHKWSCHPKASQQEWLFAAALYGFSIVNFSFCITQHVQVSLAGFKLHGSSDMFFLLIDWLLLSGKTKPSAIEYPQMNFFFLNTEIWSTGYLPVQLQPQQTDWFWH